MLSEKHVIVRKFCIKWQSPMLQIAGSNPARSAFVFLWKIVLTNQVSVNNILPFLILLFLQ
jgi:hypothetical protein